MVLGRRGLQGALGGVAAAIAFALLAPSAPAATIIGSTGTPNDALYPGLDNRVWVQDLGAGEGGSEYTAPTSGVVTSWSSQANATANRTQKLLITRNADADTSWDVISRDVLRTLTTPSALNVFTGLHLPIAAGDQIALYSPDGQPGNAPSAVYNNFPSTNVARSLTGSEPGASFTVGGAATGNTLINATATIEPDADGDTFGDETQDQCPTNAAVQATCPVAQTPAPLVTAPRAKKKCKKKRAKKGAVAAKKCKKKRK